MRQKDFEARHAALLTAIEDILADRSPAPEALPPLYRRLCQCLALAEQRGYSPALTDYLRKLALDCHNLLYGAAPERPAVLRRWLLRDFPQRVREEWRLLALACLAFFGVALAMGLLAWSDPNHAYGVMPPDKVEDMRAMYQPDRHAKGRDTGGDVLMFGFYIWNNVSIGFRTFAAGVAGGVPALLSLVFNGLHFGAVAAILSADPATREPFWSFVITHASFEVTGLLLSGVAGMRLGLTLIAPGRLRRGQALLLASRRVFPIVVGAALLTVVAAFFEGFWSAAPLPAAAKYAVGAVCWAAVIAYFLAVGRREG